MTRHSSCGNRATGKRFKKEKGPDAAGPLTNDFFSQLTLQSAHPSVRSPFSSLGELGDLMREPRNLPARVVLVNDVALRCLHQFGLRLRHRLQRRVAVAALDRFFDGADRTAQLGPARLVDDGAAGNLAGRLLGGSRNCDLSQLPLAVCRSGWSVALLAVGSDTD